MGKPTASVAGDGDDEVFLELARELKEEGGRLFNRRDYEGAAFNYGKAVQLLPAGRAAHAAEAASLRTCVARCYARMSPADHHRAIHECNLALEAAPRHSRALLLRAACFQALHRPDLAWADVGTVLAWEPANRAARELSDKVKAALEEKGIVVLDREAEPAPPRPQPEAAGSKGGEGKVKKSRRHCDSAVEEMGVSHVGNDDNEGEKLDLKNGHGNCENGISGKKQIGHVEDNHGHNKQEKQFVQKVANGTGKHQKSMEDKEINGFGEGGKDHKRGKHRAGMKNRRCVEPTDRVEVNGCKLKAESDDVHVKEEAMKDLKFVFGDDIRCAQVPGDCSLSQLREIVQNKFPSLKSFLVKYKDKEGDLVTITSSEELRWANNMADLEGPNRLYVAEVDPVQELGVDVVKRRPSFSTLETNKYDMSENGNTRHSDEQNSHVDDWMVQFARLFKNHVGFASDSYLDLHNIGMRLYSEAMEDTITSEEAQEVFQIAELKFQEMAALALFNWGNIHMCRARKRPLLTDEDSLECILEKVKTAYEWACAEYAKAGEKFEEAVKTKPEFFEGLTALGQQQFEQAKLCWYYALACKVDMGTEVLGLFNHAEDNMEKGIEIWEGQENMRLRGLSIPNKEKVILERMGLEGHMKDTSADEAFEQASNIRSHLHILWGTILYERSVVEFNLGLPSWEESLTVAMEKFKNGGASLADINVMVKNHCANETTQEGLSFKVEEIVQAWNEMYDAKRLSCGAPSFLLEPIFRRRAPKLHHILEHIHYT